MTGYTFDRLVQALEDQTDLVLKLQDEIVSLRAQLAATDSLIEWHAQNEAA